MEYSFVNDPKLKERLIKARKNNKKEMGLYQTKNKILENIF